MQLKKYRLLPSYGVLCLLPNALLAPRCPSAVFNGSYRSIRRLPAAFPTSPLAALPYPAARVQAARPPLYALLRGAAALPWARGKSRRRGAVGGALPRWRREKVACLVE